MYVAQTRHKFDDPRTKPKQSLTELDGRAMWMDGRCGLWTFWKGPIGWEYGFSFWIIPYCYYLLEARKFITRDAVNDQQINVKDYRI